MLGIIIGLLIFLVPSTYFLTAAFKKDPQRYGLDLLSDEMVVAYFFSLIFALVGFGVGVAIVCLGSGLMPTYSQGERLGFITKASTKGIIWSTNEIEMQIGSGQQAALQEPHPMSIPDSTLFEKATNNLGKKCRIEYRQWLVMPWRLGKSDYEVTTIDFVD